MNKINEGIVDFEERKMLMVEDNIHALESVKEILMISNTDFMTVKMVADYYEVGEKAINSLIFDNKEELKENGLKIISGKEVKEILVNFNNKFDNYRGYFECDGIKFSNRTNTLISKRALSNIGMYLKDSPIAIEYRRRLGIIKNPNIRKEINFLEQLEESLKPFGVVGIKQFKILSYRIDYYIPSLNIAVEYDENNHDSYTYESHEGRQKKIENILSCRFIRVSDKYSHAYNVGLVIKEIFNVNKLRGEINENMS